MMGIVGESARLFPPGLVNAVLSRRMDNELETIVWPGDLSGEMELYFSVKFFQFGPIRVQEDIHVYLE